MHPASRPTNRNHICRLCVQGSLMNLNEDSRSYSCQQEALNPRRTTGEYEVSDR